jgi:hypothetical protein
MERLKEGGFEEGFGGSCGGDDMSTRVSKGAWSSKKGKEICMLPCAHGMRDFLRIFAIPVPFRLYTHQRGRTSRQ